MNMIKKLSFYLILIITMSSCFITNTPGFYNGYKNLSENEKSQIIFVNKDSSICDLNERKIYSINASQLKECLSKNDTSIVYKWGAKCSSKNCVLIEYLQRYCDKKGYNLYVVADYYHMEEMKIQNVARYPIFIANHIYYNKYYANSLNKKFIKDLLNGSEIKGEDYYRYLMFEGESYLKSMIEI